ncbi:putative major allergen-like protein [Botryosphaeria dothidea]|uniref:Major allergen-like protein n=1 Tax=Botryosphaeria dothidea TaxID=55169 RepID=A0A8H4MYZ1_9PEZI|nr:putative major allergen-like protein [Botryosphaeria dothidea]
MQFLTIAAFAATLAAAADTVSVKDLSVRKNNGLQSASFTVQPSGDACSSTDAASLVYPRINQCGTGLYYFQIQEGESDAFKLTITKKVGMNSVTNATVDVPTYCHAGGNGADDFVCSQVGDASGTMSERFGTY